MPRENIFKWPSPIWKRQRNAGGRCSRKSSLTVFRMPGSKKLFFSTIRAKSKRSLTGHEERDATHAISPIADGVPGYHLTNTCNQGRYRIHKRIITDPQRDVLLQAIRFEALIGSSKEYSVYALLAPHIENAGYGNNGFVS